MLSAMALESGRLDLPEKIFTVLYEEPRLCQKSAPVSTHPTPARRAKKRDDRKKSG
jgi:hypothetical protein